MARMGSGQIRNVDADLWLEFKLEATRRRVGMAELFDEMMRERIAARRDRAGATNGTAAHTGRHAEAPIDQET